jgi:hypothetical protein
LREGWEELVSGYVAGNVNWNTRRLGSPPGSPDYRRFYTARAGEQHFGLVQAAIRKALETKHPSREHVDDEPARPRRKPVGLRKVYTAGADTGAVPKRPFPTSCRLPNYDA